MNMFMLFQINEILKQIILEKKIFALVKIKKKK